MHNTENQLLNRIMLILLGLLLTFGTSACRPEVSSQPDPATSQTIQPSAEPTATPTMSATPGPTNTATTEPTLTPTPTSTITPSPTPLACWQQGGKIVTGQVQTELLPLPLDFRVYLPPCYQQERERRYPVLYLIHGQSFNDDQWDRLGADESADRLVADGQVSPFLIVMPRDRVWSQPTEDMFGQAVVQALIPWIDQNYRTRTERQYRAVGGLSRGAGWALHLGFSQWELFGSIGMHSLPVFWTDLPDIKPWLDFLTPDLLPRIYMDIGEKDRPQILKSTLWFEGLLTEKGIPHEWHLYPGYHEEAYWEAHVEEYVRWYAEEW